MYISYCLCVHVCAVKSLMSKHMLELRANCTINKIWVWQKNSLFPFFY